jgi:hypothetical protein
MQAGGLAAIGHGDLHTSALAANLAGWETWPVLSDFEADRRADLLEDWRQAEEDVDDGCL